MHTLNLVALTLGVILLAGPAMAQEGRIVIGRLAKGEGVSHVLVRAGCSLDYLSQAVAESGLDLTELRRLPVGQEIALTANCKVEPSVQVAQLSGMIVKTDFGLSQTEKLRNELVELQNRVTAETAKAAVMATANAELQKQVQSLEQQLAEIKNAKTTASTEKESNQSNWKQLAISSTTGIIPGGIVAYLLLLWLNAGKVSFPTAIKIKEDGQVHIFPLVAVEETAQGSSVFIERYRCPYCPEKNLKGKIGNLRTHIYRVHPEKRVTMETDPSLRNAS